jgi:predicted peptidase
MKPLITLVFLAVLSSSALGAERPEPEVESLSEAREAEAVYLNPDYLAYHPGAVEAGARMPLLIYLHGAGGVGEDVRKIAGQSRAVVMGIERFGKGPCLVVAPQCRRESDKSEERGTWIPEDLDLLLEHLLETYSYLDPDRVYVTGNSMGGYGCWVWGGHSPQHFAAIAPIVGGIGRGGPKDVTPDLEKWAANLARVPVWAFAGANDKVVPAERSERIVAAIENAGGKRARITVYPEEGHGASRLVFSSAEFYDWMFSQVRKNGSR